MIILDTNVLSALMPRIARIATNTSFRMFSDSSAAKGAKPGDKAAKPPLSAERGPCRR